MNYNIHKYNNGEVELKTMTQINHPDSQNTFNLRYPQNDLLLTHTWKIGHYCLHLLFHTPQTLKLWEEVINSENNTSSHSTVKTYHYSGLY